MKFWSPTTFDFTIEMYHCLKILPNKKKLKVQCSYASSSIFYINLGDQTFPQFFKRFEVIWGTFTCKLAVISLNLPSNYQSLSPIHFSSHVLEEIFSMRSYSNSFLISEMWQVQQSLSSRFCSSLFLTAQ